MADVDTALHCNYIEVFNKQIRQRWTFAYCCKEGDTVEYCLFLKFIFSIVHGDVRMICFSMG